MRLRERDVPEPAAKRARERKTESPDVKRELTYDLGDGKQKYVVVEVNKRTILYFTFNSFY